MDASIDLRKKEEQEFHNKLRSDELKQDAIAYEHYTSNSKYYSIDRGNKQFVAKWLKERCKGKKVLDYCCGYGTYTFLCAEYGADAYGIDVSDVTIEKCKTSAAEKNLQDNTSFFIMDAEKMDFEDNYFDYIMCMGVLHHLDLQKAYMELSRVLKPGGQIICTEALGHNRIIQLYRRMTPHLRTKYEMEHILKMADLEKTKEYFGQVKAQFFHLATLAAVPFRNTFAFDALLGVLESIDNVLLKIPVVREQAWMVVFQLSDPKEKIK